MKTPFPEPEFNFGYLMNGRVLSYHKNLPFQAEMVDGVIKYCILGHAYQVDDKCDSPMEELKKVQTQEDIHKIIESWTGCWVLIYEEYIFMDACGLLGCFYSENGIISSSIHCINQVLKRKDRNPRIMHKFGLDYFPGPDTSYSDIKRLMPSQILNVINHSIGKRILVNTSLKYKNNDQRVNAIVSCFQNVLGQIVKEYGERIMVPLTGGYDSRTLVALLEYCNIKDYQLFTMEHDNITEQDKTLPPLIADKLQRPYQYIRRNRTSDRKRYREYNQHCAYMAADEDRNFYAYHQYPECEERTALLRANVWECAWGKYYKRISSFGDNISKFKKQYVNVRRRQDMRKSLEKWFANVRQDNQDIKFANRFYWEQRVGCWLSSVEQSLTIMECIDSIPLVNCNRILSILLDFDIETRKNKKHQVMIIEKACPELLEIPFLKEQAKRNHKKGTDEIQYLRKCLICLGFLETIKEERQHILKKLQKRKGSKNDKKN